MGLVTMLTPILRLKKTSSEKTWVLKTLVEDSSGQSLSLANATQTRLGTSSILCMTMGKTLPGQARNMRSTQTI